MRGSTKCPKCGFEFDTTPQRFGPLNPPLEKSFITLSKAEIEAARKMMKKWIEAKKRPADGKD